MRSDSTMNTGFLNTHKPEGITVFPIGISGTTYDFFAQVNMTGSTIFWGIFFIRENVIYLGIQRVMNYSLKNRNTVI